VALDGCVPSFFRDRFEGTGRGEAASRIRHEHVDGPELRFDSATHRFDVREPGDVACDLNRLAALVLDVPLHGGKALRISTMHRDLRPLMSKQSVDHGAGASRASGQPRNRTPTPLHDGPAARSTRAGAAPTRANTHPT